MFGFMYKYEESNNLVSNDDLYIFYKLYFCRTRTKFKKNQLE